MLMGWLGRWWDWRWGLEDAMLLTVGGIRRGLGWDESRTTWLEERWQLVWFIPWYDVPWVLSRKSQWAGEEVLSGGVTNLDRS